MCLRCPRYAGMKSPPEFSNCVKGVGNLGANLLSGALPTNRDRCFGTGNLGCVGGHRADRFVPDPEVCRGGN